MNQGGDMDVRVTKLREDIETINKIDDDAWKETLIQRKLAELEFLDRDRDRKSFESIDQDTFDKFYGNKNYYSATDSSREYTQKWIEREAKGKVFLEYACGNGKNAIVAAKAGAGLSLGLDISPVSVQNARADAKEAGVGDKSLFFRPITGTLSWKTIRSIQLFARACCITLIYPMPFPNCVAYCVRVASCWGLRRWTISRPSSSIA